MIRLQNVSCAVGPIEILRDISLSAAPGELVAVVGANGAGKTTMLRVISRLMPLSAGDIIFDGRSIANAEPHKLARSGLVQVPQGRQIIPSLSVEDNLRIGADRVPGMTAEAIEEGLEREYRRFPILGERRRTAGGALSGGEQQMLAVSRALMMRPKVLMLDEPSLGLAPRIVRLILDALGELAQSGMTAILVEQAALAALAIAHSGYVIQNGRIALSAPAADLLRDQALVQSYLG